MLGEVGREEQADCGAHGVVDVNQRVDDHGREHAAVVNHVAYGPAVVAYHGLHRTASAAFHDAEACGGFLHQQVTHHGLDSHAYG